MIKCVLSRPVRAALRPADNPGYMKNTKDPSSRPWMNLNIMMFGPAENRHTIGNEFMITDNLDQPDGQFTSEALAYKGYPFKIENVFLVICTKGYMKLWLNLKEYTLTPGSVIVGTPGDIGECMEVSRDNHLVMIAFDMKFLDNVDKYFYTKFQSVLSKQPMHKVGGEFLDEILDIYGMIKKKMLQSGYRYLHEAINGYMQVLCANGYQWLSEQEDLSKGEDSHGGQSRADSIFYKFLDLVHKHYSHERAIGFYADKLCLTPKYLSTVVYKASGRYAGEWIKDYVILEAKALLRSRQYTVSQVCDKLGFSSASFFVRYFKSEVGITPWKYMNE